MRCPTSGLPTWVVEGERCLSSIKNVLSFVRWRLVPVRYVGKIAAWPRVAASRQHVPRGRTAATVQEQGCLAGPRLSPEALAEIQAIFRPRVADVRPSTTGHTFVNLVKPEDFVPENPVFRFAFSADVLDVADDYFGGRFILDSIQVLYSWPTSEAPHDSQMWHKDYGDSKSLHCVVYLNDVTKIEDGPLVFVDRNDARRIRRSLIIRRITDAQFSAELGAGRIRHFFGRAGESVLVDPAVCYHYGSRCSNPRLAIFVTFNTDRPFVAPTEPILHNGSLILASARQVRSDLTESYLRRLLSL